MSALFDDLRQGLQEAIDYEKGCGTAKKTVVCSYVITPVKSFSNVEIRNIRLKASMTQAVFADYMGVSLKTVEAWECGRTHPTGPACRLMDILASGNADKLSFFKVI